jgi:hypothetical protein
MFPSSSKKVDGNYELGLLDRMFKSHYELVIS